MGKKTPLHQQHVDLGARMVDFGGWDMPVNYGSQIEEHHSVRKEAGVFDVSHMTVVDIEGESAREFLRTLLANDIAKLKAPGRALYGCMLNEQGGIIDDLITYWREENRYRLVVNAATCERDLEWITEQVKGTEGVTVSEREELAMLAIQGPAARERAAALLPAEHRDAALALKPFACGDFGDIFVARTGYTGEDGFEVVLPAERAADWWQGLMDAGVGPIGLGARDTLRLEAGLNLYGNDMDEHITPLEAGLAWTVAWEPEDRDFIGRKALVAQKEAGPRYKFVGLILEGRGVLRAHQPVHSEAGEGETTSGSFSPTLERSIGLARVPVDCGEQVEVEIRNRKVPARVVRPPFVRQGEIKVAL
ncbi:glycine cleavage system aminomethyltransferase GcvT [Natronospira bacteriovora]|uniref:Aminomethyltransferase n=1 Tax=Natronospira bacteriovora TaxID=3069753 RepID=A0ABU0W959_9GAMM|nr:glycine cleavage system aminomethyltransferase GcvT [Natronospira sp. AB-CW4]MDQ2070448.1 glycine cleavage system aminomethyltransferase GcvT [Natronospira sp. AB-CW4]